MVFAPGYPHTDPQIICYHCVCPSHIVTQILFPPVIRPLYFYPCLRAYSPRSCTPLKYAIFRGVCHKNKTTVKSATLYFFLLLEHQRCRSIRAIQPETADKWLNHVSFSTVYHYKPFYYISHYENPHYHTPTTTHLPTHPLTTLIHSLVFISSWPHRQITISLQPIHLLISIRPCSPPRLRSPKHVIALSSLMTSAVHSASCTSWRLRVFGASGSVKMPRMPRPLRNAPARSPAYMHAQM